MGLGMLTLYAHSLAEAGTAFEDLVARVEAQIAKIAVFFSVDTLDSLIRGGRLKKTQAFIGKALGIRPVLVLKPGAGAIQTAAKALSSKSAIRIAARLAAAHVRQHGICYGAGLLWAADPRFIPLLKKALLATGEDFGKIREHRIGAVIGTHLGPDGWGIVLC
jgi:DegV family protein with EDD domain